LITVIRSAISSLPSAGIIKLLKQKEFRVIGCDINEKSAARFMVDDFFLVDKAIADYEEKIIKQYKKAINDYNGRWIISGPENEIQMLAKYENEFANLNCLLFHPPSSTLDIITDKYLLHNKLNGIIPLKEICLLKDYNKANFFSSHKLILKPRNGRGSNGVFTINNSMPELIDVSNKLNNESFVLQEFIDGKEFTVDLLCDNDGLLLNAVVRERIMIDSGIAVVAKTVHNDRILEYIERIQKNFTFRGFSCIQFIEENNEFYLTDINPRIGGGSILSLNASKSMKDNFINLLSRNYDQLMYNNFDFNETMMYRYYSEVYA
jgi:carbamoyl-phosphate synthase large subunit